MALAPVPMTATFLPVRSTSWCHCAEWKCGPCERVGALDLGDVGDVQAADARDQDPRLVVLSWLVVTVQTRRSSSHDAPVTSTLKWM